MSRLLGYKAPLKTGSKGLLRLQVIGLGFGFLAACSSWVQLTAEGQAVRVAEASDVAGCRRIGSATSRTTDEILLIDRPGQRLQDELRTLARNEAGRMGGNTIVPASEIINGEQQFTVYFCS